MNYCFTEGEKQKIINNYGEVFFNKVSEDIKTYSDKWKLEILSFVDYCSSSCIFVCHSKIYGDSILKIGNFSREIFTEVNFLAEYHGGRFCELFDSDIENGIILEECIKPGLRLREERSIENRLFVFSNLFNGLHIKPVEEKIYPTYFGWVSRITKYMSEQDDQKFLYRYMKKAEDICSELCAVYSKRLLLHGDIHHDNILLTNNNKYKIIDPKGVIGDPIFDIPRFILNEFYTDENISYEFYRNHVEKIVKYFERSLDLPIDIIKKCIFIETAMANCWNVESDKKTDINSVIYAESMIGD